MERLLSENLLAHNIFCNYWNGKFEGAADDYDVIADVDVPAAAAADDGGGDGGDDAADDVNAGDDEI